MTARYELNVRKKSVLRYFREAYWLLRDKYHYGIAGSVFSDVKRMLSGEQIDYIIGSTSFCGARIDLSLRPLIPRPTTERWVAEAIAKIASSSATPRVLDIFAGSGCIGIALLKRIPEAHVDFTDIDPDAIRQIKINAELNAIPPERYRILRSDMFSAIDGAYDFILANPPYVPTSVRHRVVPASIAYEPQRALFAGDDGLSIIRPFLAEASRHLHPSGALWMEFAWISDEVIRNEAVCSGYKNIQIEHIEGGGSCLVLENH